jgi:hypothetical protein
LLGVAHQHIRPLGLRAHALDGVHDIRRLRQKRVPQFRGPLHVAGKALDHIRHRDHGLDAGIPRLLLHGVGQRLILQILVPRQPLLKLDDFERIGGGHQRLAQQWIGIERDGSDQGVQLIIREPPRLLRSGVCGSGCSAACGGILT